jgi:hypothetical protein
MRIKAPYSKFKHRDAGMTRSPEFVLDEDELDHMQAISQELIGRLSLINKAGILAVDGLYASTDNPSPFESKAIIALFLGKSAQNVRFAVHGLTLGYYGGALASVRSGMEALEYASLFIR